MILGAVILFVAFDGIRLSCPDYISIDFKIIFPIIGIGVPWLIGAFLLMPRDGKPGYVESAVSLWPLCVMRLWPLVSGLKTWDYSYTLSVSERDVAGFLLYLAAVAVWMYIPVKYEEKQIEEDKPLRWDYSGYYGLYGAWLLIFLTVIPAIKRLATFHAKAWDMAIFSQLSHNIVNGNGFEVSVRGLSSILADHFQPIMLLIAAICAPFHRGSEALVVIQMVIVALGAIPIALICRKSGRAGSPGIFIYAFYPITLLLLTNDFHPIALVVPLFLWAFYFLEIKRMWAFYIFLLLAACCQEEAWIITGMVGLYLALFRGMKKSGIIVFIVSWLIFFILVLAVIPSFRAEGNYFYLHRYAYLGSSAGEIAKNVFLHPGLWLKRMFDTRSIAFVVMLLAPLGFLPLRRPKILFILIPVAFYTLISGYDIQKSIFHQYAAPFIPFLFLALLDSFEKSTDGKARARNMKLGCGVLWAAICSSAMVGLFAFGGHPEIYSYIYSSTFDTRLNNHFLAQIEANDNVSTISKYAPPLSDRRFLTLFPNIQWEGEWADKILVDGKELISEKDRKALAEILYGENEGPKYGLLYYYDGVFLFEKEYESAPFSRIMSSAMPPVEGMTKPSGGNVYKTGKLLSAELIPFEPGDNEISKIVSRVDSPLYWLKMMLSVDKDFDDTWFFAVRCEDKNGNVLFTFPHFPLYGPYYDKATATNAEHKAGIFDRSPRILKEAYVIDPRQHPRKPRWHFTDTRDYGEPAYLRVMPLKLPDGWTNTLDEYVTEREQTVGLPWSSAFVVDLNEKGS